MDSASATWFVVFFPLAVPEAAPPQFGEKLFEPTDRSDLTLSKSLFLWNIWKMLAESLYLIIGEFS